MNSNNAITSGKKVCSDIVCWALLTLFDLKLVNMPFKGRKKITGVFRL